MSNETGMYLSDDQESRLRLLAPAPCHQCQHLRVKLSPVFDAPLKGCEAAGNNEVLGRVLLRFAESGRCDERLPFDGDARCGGE